MSTQWARTGFGHVTGLDYAGVEAGLRLAGITLVGEEFAQLREIEIGARSRLNERTGAA